MKSRFQILFVFLLSFYAFAHSDEAVSREMHPLGVVATLPDYGAIAESIGGERVAVKTIVQGDQDAHFIRPKPSFVSMVQRADVLLSTGLDLELWLSTVVDKSGNNKIRSGRPGYVAVAHGIHLLEKPLVKSRSEGGVHIYGNPHINCSPINMKTVARNIYVGLIKNDPEGKEIYLENLNRLLDEFDKQLFGEELVQMLGGDTLCSMAEKDTLVPFLEKQEFRGKPLLGYLGGWMKKMLPLRGTPIVTYHKNWIYFLKLFGMEEVGTVEPKPGIPPSARHVTELVELMRNRNVKILLAANYFDEQKIRTVAGRVDAAAVIVSLYVGGTPGVKNSFQLYDYWIEGLLKAAGEKGLIEAK